MNANTLDEIRDLQQFFTSANALLKEGQIVDMTGVEIRISKVCQAAQQAEPNLQQKYLPELTVLIDLLNTYETDLRSLQKALKTKTNDSK